jgi:RNA polymerase sigma factor (sigma-70 family)
MMPLPWPTAAPCLSVAVAWKSGLYLINSWYEATLASNGQGCYGEMEKRHEDLKNLFKEEFAKMVAVISRTFGLDHIELAEDLVSETFLQAAETWAIQGLPPNPQAWLYAVARQKTLYYLRRDKLFRSKVSPAVAEEENLFTPFPEPNFSGQNIKDSQLAMIFAVCVPAIAAEAQVGLALRILCGFGIDEIADAFFTNKETINKRLYRAKAKLRSEMITMELPLKAMVSERLDNVLHIIYLLFNEGYYSRTKSETLRKELCFEGLRLGLLLTEFEVTNLPKTNALLALMCFHASRLSARQSSNDQLITYQMQDETLWDNDLINRGVYYLDRASQGNELSSYHIEAQIAYWHSFKDDTPKKWQAVLKLYDQLLLLNYSPAVALNRTYALYKAKGWRAALDEAESLKLENDHFYFVLLGELYKNESPAKARESFQRALVLAKTPAEKKDILLKIKRLNT